MSEQSTNPFPRLLRWTVWNFMSIEHATVEFDDRNIINLKGYNDSGKSAMITALKVLMCNSNPSKQVGFIQDDKDYFRILAEFEGDIKIMRDKYINGQSLYEMYKGEECIYSTKSGNALSRVTDVPQPIADFLGLIIFDGTCLNARACFEKQIGVQNTGSENYKMFNTVLKSEEIASAGAMLNTDRNKLGNDISAVDSEIQSYKTLIEGVENLTGDMINYLKEHDSELDKALVMEESLTNINSLKTSVNSIIINPEVESVDTAQLDAIFGIGQIQDSLSGVSITPEVPDIDNAQLEELERIAGVASSLAQVSVAPEVASIDLTQLEALSTLNTLVNNIKDCDSIIEDDTNRLNAITVELEDLQKELSNHGIKMVKCPGCGQIFNPEEAHVH